MSNLHGVRLVVVTGMPACGKTTLLEHLSAAVRALGGLPIQLSIDDVLRIQCPEGRFEHAGQRLFERAGVHFMLSDSWRPFQMELAARGMLPAAEVLVRTQSSNGFAADRFVILEVPTTELGTLVEELLRCGCEPGIIVHLHAPVGIRSDRNDLRIPPKRLPRVVFEYFEAARNRNEIDIQTHLKDLIQLEWMVLDQSTEGSEQPTMNRICRVIGESL